MEGKIIEYKEALPGDSDKDKREFLADVSSFANTAGGVLYLGIREDSGVPVELTGLPVGQVDDATRLAVAEADELRSHLQRSLMPFPELLLQRPEAKGDGLEAREDPRPPLCPLGRARTVSGLCVLPQVLPGREASVP